MTRPTTFDSPYYAYAYACYVDEAPRDDTRQAACRDPYYAYRYARDVDKAPRDDTRQAACGNPGGAYAYALDVDEGPRDDTRAAACASPGYAYYYARDVDKAPRDDTRQAACASPADAYAYRYARYVDGRKPVRLGEVSGYEVTYLAGAVNVGCQYRTVDDWAENWRTYAADDGLEPAPADVEALLEAARAAAGKEATP